MDPDTEAAEAFALEQECHRWQTERNNEFEEWLNQPTKENDCVINREG